MTVAQIHSTRSTTPGTPGMELKLLRDTVLKQKPVQSSQLSESEKQPLAGGTILQLHSFTPEGDHVKVAFRDREYRGLNTWYVYYKHAVVTKNSEITFPDRIKLPVPYKSQLDNRQHPYGSCNTTSIAMCLAYFGIRGNNPYQQLEDELQDWLVARGLDRHEATHLAQAVEAYGARDRFKTNASINEVKEWLVQGNPAVIHGYFTSYGHIVSVVGYNSYGFLVNDPYGEYWPHGYDTSAAGAGLSYSYRMIQETCMGDGDFWVHFISK